MLRNLKSTSVIIAEPICSKQQCKLQQILFYGLSVPMNVLSVAHKMWVAHEPEYSSFQLEMLPKKNKLWELGLNSLYQILGWERGEEFVINL